MESSGECMSNNAALATLGEGSCASGVTLDIRCQEGVAPCIFPVGFVSISCLNLFFPISSKIL